MTRLAGNSCSDRRQMPGMTSSTVLGTCCLCVALSAVFLAAQSSTYRLLGDDVSQAGEVRGSSERYKLQDSIGQPSPVGISSSSTAVLLAGFDRTVYRLGDFDLDARVDLDDFFLFADNFGTKSGSESWHPKFDLEHNGAIDLADFFVFAGQFGS